MAEQCCNQKTAMAADPPRAWVGVSARCNDREQRQRTDGKRVAHPRVPPMTPDTESMNLAAFSQTCHAGVVVASRDRSSVSVMNDFPDTEDTPGTCRGGPPPA